MGLFGLTPAKTEKAQSLAPPDAVIFDVGTQDFELRALKASMQKPVLVDFWAPWCGPCKQLMPILESEVRAANGEILLAKVNIDENPDLAQALRIQSVPTVMAFFQGQPVTGFTGARPASEIKNLIAQLVKLARSSMPDALDIPAALKQACTLLANGEDQFAQELYIQILQQDPNNIDAYNGMVRTLIAANALDQAQSYIDEAPEAIAKNPAFSSSKTALDLARNASAAAGPLKSLLKKVEAAPDDHQARFDLAAAHYASNNRAAAIDTLLDLIRRDRTWNDEAARKELLRYFEAMGFSDPLCVDGRKKLSRLLFS